MTTTPAPRAMWFPLVAGLVTLTACGFVPDRSTPTGTGSRSDDYPLSVTATETGFDVLVPLCAGDTETALGVIRGADGTFLTHGGAGGPSEDVLLVLTITPTSLGQGMLTAELPVEQSDLGFSADAGDRLSDLDIFLYSYSSTAYATAPLEFFEALEEGSTLQPIGGLANKRESWRSAHPLSNGDVQEFCEHSRARR